VHAARMNRPTAPRGQTGRPDTAVVAPSGTNPAPKLHTRLPLIVEHDPTHDGQGKWTTEMRWRSHKRRSHQWRRYQTRSQQRSTQVALKHEETFSSIDLASSTAPCRLGTFPLLTRAPAPSAAANTAGAAAPHRDEQTGCQYQRQGSTGYSFLTLETYGRLGKPLMRLLGDVGQLAADWGQGLFTKQQFVRGVPRELRVGL
jgi:hypothetical protein